MSSCDIYRRDKNEHDFMGAKGCTPVLRIGKNDLACVKAMAEGAHKNDVKDRACFSVALDFAVCQKKFEVAQFILDQFPHVDPTITVFENSVLDSAIASGAPDKLITSLVLRAVKKKKGVDFKNGKGDTLLHTAVANGRADAVEILVKAEADIGVVDAKGQNPLFLSCMAKDSSCLDAIIESIGLRVDVNQLNDLEYGKIRLIYSDTLEELLKCGEYNAARQLMSKSQGFILNTCKTGDIKSTVLEVATKMKAPLDVINRLQMLGADPKLSIRLAEKLGFLNITETLLKPTTYANNVEALTQFFGHGSIPGNSMG